MQTEIHSLWDHALDILRESVGEGAYNMWLSPLEPRDLTDDARFTIAARHEFNRSWVEGQYLSTIADALESLTGIRFEVEIVVDPTIEEKKSTPAGTPDIHQNSSVAAVAHETIPDAFSEVEDEPRSVIDFSDATRSPNTRTVSSTDQGTFSKYTFENFIVGDSNEFARHAAMAVAERPGHMYNPLFMYGGSGLGKTHLLHSIANYISQHLPHLRVHYTPAIEFVNHFVQATSQRKTSPRAMDEFHKIYRSADVLLIDDLQQFEGKSGSEEAFFDIFNELVNRGKQIVMAADRPPRDLKMDERYKSRFKQGLEADIHPPTYEMKLAILQGYVRYTRTDLSDDILKYLAEVSTGNIREIEGAVNRLTAFMSFRRMKYLDDVSVVRDALKDFFPDSSHKVIDVKTIQREVCNYYQITNAEMMGSKRSHNIVLPRQVAMYLTRSLTDLSLPKIGEAFNKDHSTVIHANTKIQKVMKENKNIYEQINDLTALIKQRS